MLSLDLHLITVTPMADGELPATLIHMADTAVPHSHSDNHVHIYILSRVPISLLLYNVHPADVQVSADRQWPVLPASPANTASQATITLGCCSTS